MSVKRAECRYNTCRLCSFSTWSEPRASVWPFFTVVPKMPLFFLRLMRQSVHSSQGTPSFSIWSEPHASVCPFFTGNQCVILYNIEWSCFQRVIIHLSVARAFFSCLLPSCVLASSFLVCPEFFGSSFRLSSCVLFLCLLLMRHFSSVKRSRNFR